MTQAFSGQLSDFRTDVADAFEADAKRTSATKDLSNFPFLEEMSLDPLLNDYLDEKKKACEIIVCNCCFLSVIQR